MKKSISLLVALTALWVGFVQPTPSFAGEGPRSVNNLRKNQCQDLRTSFDKIVDLAYYPKGKTPLKKSIYASKCKAEIIRRITQKDFKDKDIYPERLRLIYSHYSLDPQGTMLLLSSLQDKWEELYLLETYLNQQVAFERKKADFDFWFTILLTLGEAASFAKVLPAKWAMSSLKFSFFAATMKGFAVTAGADAFASYRVDTKNYIHHYQGQSIPMAPAEIIDFFDKDPQEAALEYDFNHYRAHMAGIGAGIAVGFAAGRIAAKLIAQSKNVKAAFDAVRAVRAARGFIKAAKTIATLRTLFAAGKVAAGGTLVTAVVTIPATLLAEHLIVTAYESSVVHGLKQDIRIAMENLRVAVDTFADNDPVTLEAAADLVSKVKVWQGYHSQALNEVKSRFLLSAVTLVENSHLDAENEAFKNSLSELYSEYRSEIFKVYQGMMMQRGLPDAYAQFRLKRSLWGLSSAHAAEKVSFMNEKLKWIALSASMTEAQSTEEIENKRAENLNYATHLTGKWFVEWKKRAYQSDSRGKIGPFRAHNGRGIAVRNGPVERYEYLSDMTEEEQFQSYLRSRNDPIDDLLVAQMDHLDFDTHPFGSMMQLAAFFRKLEYQNPIMGLYARAVMNQIETDMMMVLRPDPLFEGDEQGGYFNQVYNLSRKLKAQTQTIDASEGRNQ